MLSTQSAAHLAASIQQQHHHYSSIILDEKSSSGSGDLLSQLDFGQSNLHLQHQHLQQQQHQHEMSVWGGPAPAMKFDCGGGMQDAFQQHWQCGGYSNDFRLNNDAYYNSSQSAAAAAGQPNSATSSTPPAIPPDSGSSSNGVKPSASPNQQQHLADQSDGLIDLEAEGSAVANQVDDIGTHNEPGPYNLQLRLEETDSQAAPSFHQRLNASGGSSLWYAIGFHSTEKDIMQRALTAPDEKITKSIVLRNREVLASLWCKELAPVRLYLHGNFEAAMSGSQAVRLVIRCGAFKQHQLPVKECTVCSDQKHRGGWYGADKRDTNSSKNIPESLRAYWPADNRTPTVHKNSLVIVGNDACEYHTDSRDRVYAVLPINNRQPSGPVQLMLYYTCMTTHSHDATAPNSKDTFTSVQLETLDSITGRWFSRGRCVFRMRMVTSPERDILNEVTQFLTPAQMGCRMGCGHLESHNTRWQRAKVLRTQGQDKFDYYVQLYGSEPGIKFSKGKAKSRQATGSNADPTDDLELLDSGAASAVPTLPAAASSDTLSQLEVVEQAADGSLIIRGALLSNHESRELIAGALRAYLASLPLIVKGVATAAAVANNNSRSAAQTKQEPLQQQQGMPRENSPAESFHSSAHCPSVASSASDQNSSVATYHMPEVPPTTASAVMTSLPPSTEMLGGPVMMQQDQYLSQPQQAVPASVQYFNLQGCSSTTTPAAPAPVYFINHQMAAAAAAAAAASSSSSSSSNNTGSVCGPSLLPPLQHIAAASSEYQQQQQQPAYQQYQGHPTLLMPQQLPIHQQIILRAGFGQDQVDGAAGMEESEDIKPPAGEQVQYQQQKQQQQRAVLSRKSASSLFRRLANVKRRRMRAGAGSLGQLFKAKQQQQERE